MSDKTKIEWTDATVNAVNGCTVVSPGCTNCYAMRLAGTRMRSHPTREGLTTDSKAGPVWNGQVRFNETALLQPLRWKKPRKIFWNAHGDLFHPAVPDWWIDRCFAVMALTPQHVHQVLTKRSARMREYMTRLSAMWHDAGDPFDDRIGTLLVELSGSPCAIGMWEEEFVLPHVWLGVSVEDQERRARLLDLAATPASVRFVSGEPLLEGVTLTDIPIQTDEWGREWLFDALSGEQYFVDDLGFKVSGDGPDMEPLDWVIVGGESGPSARPMHPDWARSLRDQCAAAGVPFHFKQWGSCLPGNMDGEDERGNPAYNIEDAAQPVDYDDLGRGKLVQAGGDFIRFNHKRTGRLLDGMQHDGMPA
tara:strand:+ start:3195 stop:4283 length:1089 start_codon:yes stop_codon:yes gene_type:complete